GGRTMAKYLAYQAEICGTDFFQDQSSRGESRLHEVLRAIIRPCLRRVRSWMPPRNWSGGGWREGLCQILWQAALEAARDFDPSRGTSFVGFVRNRALARTLASYRREFLYSQRFIRETLDQNDGESDGACRLKPVAEALAAEDSIGHYFLL